LEIDRIDLGQLDETGYVNGSRPTRGYIRQLLRIDDDVIVAADVVPFDYLVVIDLIARPLVHPAVTYPISGALELVKVHSVILGRTEEC
jgi:hypothetical protein